MIKQYAVIENNIVQNIILIDEQNLSIFNDLTIAEIPENLVVNVGFSFINNEFIDPDPVNTSHVFNMEAALTFEEIEEIINELLQNGN